MICIALLWELVTPRFHFLIVKVNNMPTMKYKTAGFTYLGLLILIAIIGIATQTTLILGMVMKRRIAEEQLLAIGKEFGNAFESYANTSAPGRPRYPVSLQDLLKDPRSPTIRRHLRKIYIDPLTGDDQWGEVPAIPGPGISGLYSLAKGQPIKIANFDTRFEDFEEKNSYQQWIFAARDSMLQSPTSIVGISPAKTDNK